MGAEEIAAMKEFTDRYMSADMKGITVALMSFENLLRVALTKDSMNVDEAVNYLQQVYPGRARGGGGKGLWGIRYWAAIWDLR